MPNRTPFALAGWLAAALLLPLSAALAQEPAGPPSAREGREARGGEGRGGAEAVGRGEAKVPDEQIVVTHHRATIGGKEIHYTATAGTMVQKTEAGKPKASMFFVAYTRDMPAGGPPRPITYTFNGGPGSASVWLHMGAFGPRRVVMDDEGKALPPPYRLTDNGESLLDVTDLLFIDPVTTGYSREAPGEDPQQFHGVREDLTSVGEFIRLWTSRYGRWSSPKFLAGESYGTTRAAALSNYLQSQDGMYLSGIILISTVLNFETTSFDIGNDLAYPLFLPTYSASAWYHKKLPADLQGGDLQKVLAESERYALGDYTLALAQGARLPEAARQEVAAKLARLTGLSAQYLLAANLRPTIGGFTKELMRSERQTVGRLDSRFQGMDLNATAEKPEYDPSYAAIQGPYTAVINDYARNDLGFKSDLPYEILTNRVQPWSYRETQNRYLNVAEELRKAMTQNPDLRVYVGAGYYDLATPFFAARYTFDHLGFEPTFHDRVTWGFYESGHMVYLRKVDREKLKSDVAKFIAAATDSKK